MSHLARQYMVFARHFTLDEMLASIERITSEDVRRVATNLFQERGLVATVVGPAAESPLSADLRV